jgi:hypothetical protein
MLTEGSRPDHNGRTAAVIVMTMMPVIMTRFDMNRQPAAMIVMAPALMAVMVAMNAVANDDRLRRSRYRHADRSRGSNRQSNFLHMSSSGTNPCI